MGSTRKVGISLGKAERFWMVVRMSVSVVLGGVTQARRPDWCVPVFIYVPSFVLPVE